MIGENHQLFAKMSD